MGKSFFKNRANRNLTIIRKLDAPVSPVDSALAASASATSISKVDLKALRGLIRVRAWQGVTQQMRDSWEYATDSGWYPTCQMDADRRGAAASACYAAEQKDVSDWKAASKAIANSPAYSSLVKDFGRDEVFNQIHGWSATPDEARQVILDRMDYDAQAAVDARDGKAGDIKELAALFPRHVKAVDWYSEGGDGGWAGGGPDSYASGTDYKPLTDAGAAALDAVKGGARTKVAMAAALDLVKIK